MVAALTALNRACSRLLRSPNTALFASARAQQPSARIRQNAITAPSRFPAAVAQRQSAHATPRRLFSQTRRRPYQNYHNNNNPHDPHERLRNAKPLFTDGGLRGFIRSPSTHTVAALAFLGAVGFYFYNLQTVPVSGRKRFNCFTEESVEAVSEQQVKRIEWEVERQGGRFLSDWDPRTRMVKRVMRRLIPVSGMEDSDWEVRVIDDPRQANAFVLPGGKVFVYSGIIPIARNEDGLAAVLGHEIAHNLAQHIGERMSGQIGINILLGSFVLLTALWGGAILGTQLFGGTVLDLLFSRPMGRKQETEADYIGLLMMAEACYDPEQALGFWQRMEHMEHQQEAPPEWMSTHPSNHNRIEKIKKWLPEAMDKRAQSDCSGTAAFADRFRRALAQGLIIPVQ
ncbi:mitochondrial metalloendopeptidase OMA1 [Apiospora hydei]|uniref:Mitochondrial metalloendopeptidase OMA1 n=1 Tax=Apiospora hydei TaxID=1337664 RepID=A0ABR1X2Q6_9PEZI